MIIIDRERCTGCGICTEVCPTGAIILVTNRAEVDTMLCDGCASLANSTPVQQCVEVCPMEAPRWAIVPDSSTAILAQPSVEVIPAGTSQTQVTKVVNGDMITVHERERSVLPAFGSALTWVGREIVPRLAPLALKVLDVALDRRNAGKDSKVSPSYASKGETQSTGRGANKQRRRHRRRGP